MTLATTKLDTNAIQIVHRPVKSSISCSASSKGFESNWDPGVNGSVSISVSAKTFTGKIIRNDKIVIKNNLSKFFQSKNPVPAR